MADYLSYENVHERGKIIQNAAEFQKVHRGLSKLPVILLWIIIRRPKSRITDGRKQ